MSSKHSRLSPSSSKRWLSCTGSINLIEKLNITVQPQSIYAEEGNIAHELAHVLLQFHPDPDDEIYNFIKSDYILQYVNYVRNIIGFSYFESKIDLDWLVDEKCRGTIDCMIHNPANKELHIIDLKYGKNILEIAEENSQLLMYALGAYKKLEKFEIKTINLHIIQPRMDNFSIWQITNDELLKRGEYIKHQAEQTRQLNAPLNPSKANCMWCPVKKHCDEAYGFKSQQLNQLNLFNILE